MRQDTNFSSMDKHFIVEYPLQRNQALGNEYSSDRNLKDAACALLQFSLRPVSRTQLRTAEIQYLYPTEIGDTQPGITVAVNNVAATVEQISTSNPNSQLSRSVEEGEMKISLNINPETSSVLILYDPAILRFVNEMEDDNTANELQKLRASIEFVGGLTPMENEEAITVDGAIPPALDLKQIGGRFGGFSISDKILARQSIRAGTWGASDTTTVESISALCSNYIAHL